MQNGIASTTIMIFNRIPASEICLVLCEYLVELCQPITLSEHSFIFFFNYKSNRCSLYKTNLRWGKENVEKYKGEIESNLMPQPFSHYK